MTTQNLNENTDSSVEESSNNNVESTESNKSSSYARLALFLSIICLCFLFVFAIWGNYIGKKLDTKVSQIDHDALVMSFDQTRQIAQSALDKGELLEKELDTKVSQVDFDELVLYSVDTRNIAQSALDKAVAADKQTISNSKRINALSHKIKQNKKSVQTLRNDTNNSVVLLSYDNLILEQSIRKIKSVQKDLVKEECTSWDYKADTLLCIAEK